MVCRQAKYAHLGRNLFSSGRSKCLGTYLQFTLRLASMTNVLPKYYTVGNCVAALG